MVSNPGKGSSIMDEALRLLSVNPLWLPYAEEYAKAEKIHPSREEIAEVIGANLSEINDWWIEAEFVNGLSLYCEAVAQGYRGMSILGQAKKAATGSTAAARLHHDVGDPVQERKRIAAKQKQERADERTTDRLLASLRGTQRDLLNCAEDNVMDAQLMDSVGAQQLYNLKDRDWKKIYFDDIVFIENGGVVSFKTFFEEK